METVRSIITAASARRERYSFYTANPAAAAADDDQTIAALRAATTTNDDCTSLRCFLDAVNSNITQALMRLEHQQRPPPRPRRSTARVRRFAFFLRCLREVHDPWFQRLLEATDYLMAPLRALEASIAAHIIDAEQLIDCNQMVFALGLLPHNMCAEHIHTIHQQLLSIQTRLSSIRITSAQTAARRTCLFYLSILIPCVITDLDKATQRRQMDPHLELADFRDQYRALLDDADNVVFWPRSGYHIVSELCAILPELGEPNPTERILGSDAGENLTLKQRIHAMLAELDDMRLHSFDEHDPRRFGCMAAQVMLQDLLLRIDDALEQRELAYAVPRRLALAQAFARHTAPPPIAAIGDDLVSTIARMSVSDPPRWWWRP